MQPVHAGQMNLKYHAQTLFDWMQKHVFFVFLKINKPNYFTILPAGVYGCLYLLIHFYGTTISILVCINIVSAFNVQNVKVVQWRQHDKKKYNAIRLRQIWVTSYLEDLVSFEYEKCYQNVTQLPDWNLHWNIERVPTYFDLRIFQSVNAFTMRNF